MYTREELFNLVSEYLGVGRRVFGELISKYDLVGERRTLPSPQKGSYKVYSRREVIEWIGRIKAGETERLNTLLGYFLIMASEEDEIDASVPSV